MKILIASPIDPAAIERLRAAHDVHCAFNASVPMLIDCIQDREILIFRSGVEISTRVLEAAIALRLLIRAGSGLDNLAIDTVQARGLELVRIPEPGAQAVAELAFGMMLGLSRQVLTADRLLRQGRWAKSELEGFLLHDKTLGIIGAGNIGRRVGRMGTAWGMRVHGCVEHPSPARAKELQREGIRLTSCTEVLQAADFVSVHVPLKDSTQHLIDSQAIALMKPGAYLTNLARGGVVDEAALLEALTSGHLAGAGLDVHQVEGEGMASPLAGLPNVILTPHIGAMTVDSQREIGRRIVEIVANHTGDRTLAAHPGTAARDR